MNPHEPDGINDALAEKLAVALTAAGQLAERAARAREQQARRAQAASEHEARELHARLDAQRAAARAALAPVHQAEWWQHADLDQITQAWETAQTWRHLDPDARRAVERIHHELRERYHLDTRDLRADPDAVRQALTVRDATLTHADVQRGEDAPAAAVSAGAVRTHAAQHRGHEHQQRVHPGDHLPEAARREDLAAALEGIADTETIAARVIAATNQGRPAAEAVTTPPTRAPRTRRARATGLIRNRARAR